MAENRMAMVDFGALGLLADMAAAEYDRIQQRKFSWEGKHKVTLPQKGGVKSKLYPKPPLRRSARTTGKDKKMVKPEPRRSARGKGTRIMVCEGDLDLNLPPDDSLREAVRGVLRSIKSVKIGPDDFLEVVMMVLQAKFGIDQHAYRDRLQSMILWEYEHTPPPPASGGDNIVR